MSLFKIKTAVSMPTFLFIRQVAIKPPPTY
jgi:hypothetical protein